MRRIVLFDGVCVFCEGATRWLAARDPQGLLQFAALQGETAAELRERHPEIPKELETMVLVEIEAGAERVFFDSEAVLRVLAELESPFRHLAALRVLPRALRDPAYRLFARNRYRLFGHKDQCELPAPDEAPRFLR